MGVWRGGSHFGSSTELNTFPCFYLWVLISENGPETFLDQIPYLCVKSISSHRIFPVFPVGMQHLIVVFKISQAQVGIQNSLEQHQETFLYYTSKRVLLTGNILLVARAEICILDQNLLNSERINNRGRPQTHASSFRKTRT